MVFENLGMQCGRKEEESRLSCKRDSWKQWESAGFQLPVSKGIVFTYGPGQWGHTKGAFDRIRLGALQKILSPEYSSQQMKAGTVVGRGKGFSVLGVVG